jgi:hypothetical protein
MTAGAHLTSPHHLTSRPRANALSALGAVVAVVAVSAPLDGGIPGGLIGSAWRVWIRRRVPAVSPGVARAAHSRFGWEPAGVE